VREKEAERLRQRQTPEHPTLIDIASASSIGLSVTLRARQFNIAACLSAQRPVMLMVEVQTVPPQIAVSFAAPSHLGDNVRPQLLPAFRLQHIPIALPPLPPFTVMAPRAKQFDIAACLSA
jgi:hypothetical protein